MGQTILGKKSLIFLIVSNFSSLVVTDDAGAQIAFLNSIIADMQKKNEHLLLRISALEESPQDFIKYVCVKQIGDYPTDSDERGLFHFPEIAYTMCPFDGSQRRGYSAIFAMSSMRTKLKIARCNRPERHRRRRPIHRPPAQRRQRRRPTAKSERFRHRGNTVNCAKVNDCEKIAEITGVYIIIVLFSPSSQHSDTKQPNAMRTRRIE